MPDLYAMNFKNLPSPKVFIYLQPDTNIKRSKLKKNYFINLGNGLIYRIFAADMVC